MARQRNFIQPATIAAIEAISFSFEFTYSNFPHPPHTMGDGGLFDCAAHATNVWGTGILDTATTWLGLHKALFNTISRKRAGYIAAATLVVGATVNAAIETPSSAHFLGSHISRLQGTPDWRDELYGDAADIVTVGALYKAMCFRRKGEGLLFTNVDPVAISYENTVLTAPLTFSSTDEMNINNQPVSPNIAFSDSNHPAKCDP